MIPFSIWVIGGGRAYNALHVLWFGKIAHARMGQKFDIDKKERRTKNIEIKRRKFNAVRQNSHLKGGGGS